MRQTIDCIEGSLSVVSVPTTFLHVSFWIVVDLSVSAITSLDENFPWPYRTPM
jgi:hypothetical protein